MCDRFLYSHTHTSHRDGHHIHTSFVMDFSHKMHRVMLDIDYLKYIRHLFHTNITVGACVNILSHYLVPERVISFFRNGDKLELTNSELDQWDTIATEIFSQILCWGFVMVMRRDDGTIRSVDLCEVSQLEFDPMTGEIVATRCPTGDFAHNHKNDDIFIINAFSASPLSDGTMTSTMSKVVHTIEFMQSLERCASSIETQKVHPDVFCHTVNADKKHKEGDQYETRVLGDPMMFPGHFGTTSNSLYERTNDARRKRQKMLCEMQDSIDDDNRRDAQYSKLYSEPTSQRYHALPSNLNIAKVFSTQGRSDFVSVKRLSDQNICAMLGVPRTMLVNDGVARADTQATHDMFRVSLKRYRKQVEHALTVIGTLHYSDIVTAKLPDSFHGPPEELLKLYVLGVITFQAYASIVSSIYNVNADTGNIVPPLSDEERKGLILECMKSMVTQHHGRS